MPKGDSHTRVFTHPSSLLAQFIVQRTPRSPTRASRPSRHGTSPPPLHSPPPCPPFLSSRPPPGGFLEGAGCRYRPCQEGAALLLRYASRRVLRVPTALFGRLLRPALDPGMGFWAGVGGGAGASPPIQRCPQAQELPPGSAQIHTTSDRLFERPKAPGPWVGPHSRSPPLLSPLKCQARSPRRWTCCPPPPYRP